LIIQIGMYRRGSTILTLQSGSKCQHGALFFRDPPSWLGTTISIARTPGQHQLPPENPHAQYYHIWPSRVLKTRMNPLRWKKGTVKYEMYHGDLWVVRKRGDNGACGYKLTGSSSSMPCASSIDVEISFGSLVLTNSRTVVDVTGGNLSMLQILQQHNDTRRKRGIL